MFKEDKNCETQYCKNCFELAEKLELKETECKRLREYLQKIAEAMM